MTILFDVLGVLNEAETKEWLQLFDEIEASGHKVGVVTTNRFYKEGDTGIPLERFAENAVFLGVKKSDPASYVEIADMLNENLEDIFVIDDSSAHVGVANEAGANGILFERNFKKLREQLIEMRVLKPVLEG